MRKRPAPAALLSAFAASLVLLAGCLDGANEGGDGGDPKGGPIDFPPPPEDPMPEGDGHDHAAAAQHDFLWNYALASFDPLGASLVSPSGLHALARGGDLLFGALYGQANSPGGLVVWDLAQPENPRKAGELRIPGAVGGDRSLDATADGHFAVLGTEPLTCFGHVNPFSVPVPVYLIDTRDPASPAVADVITVTGGSLGDPDNVAPTALIHSVTVHRIGETDYASVFGSLYRIEREPAPALVPVGSIRLGHDLYLRDTPQGKVWGLAANEDGLTIHDLTDPLQPVEIATWVAPGKEELEAKGIKYYIHTADVAFLADGRALVVVTSEDWEAHPSPFWVLDATPLLGASRDGESFHLETLAQWTNPGGHDATGAAFSLHNPRVHDTSILTLSSYHGGIWQFELKAVEPGLGPAPIAYMVKATMDGSLRNPQEDAIESQYCEIGGFEPPEFHNSPEVMDVEPGPGGIVYAADHTGGLQTFAPTATHPVFASG